MTYKAKYQEFYHPKKKAKEKDAFIQEIHPVISWNINAYPKEPSIRKTFNWWLKPFNAENHAEPSRVLPSILSHFKIFLEVFVNTWPRAMRNIALSKTKWNPQELEQELIKVQGHFFFFFFLYLNKTPQKIISEHQVFKVAVSHWCCHCKSLVARNLKFLEFPSLWALSFKGLLQSSVFKHTQEEIHLAPCRPMCALKFTHSYTHPYTSNQYLFFSQNNTLTICNWFKYFLSYTLLFLKNSGPLLCSTENSP